nr:ring canal kelch protein-like isoform X1 [Quercus suber]XP_023903306.1 ring canal kelch protein-like isoform X1 [Quercus suber]
MGAGRKTQTFIVNENASSPKSVNGSTAVRNLSKSHLGGVIFGCKNSTMKECLFKQLFGSPAQHFSYVKNIDPGLPLFLFNYNDRKLHGIFEAASNGQMNINPYGWTTDGSERTSYPAQVQIRVRLRCQPLLENQFKPIISDNYYSQNHFWFELDHAQASRLMSLLSSLVVAPSASVPQNTAKWKTIFQALPPNDAGEEGEGFKPLSLETEHSNYSSWKSDSTVVASSFDGNNQPLGARLDTKLVKQDEKDIIFMKLKELSLQPVSSSSNGTSFPCNSQVEGQAIGSRPNDSMCDLPIERKELAVPMSGYVDDTAVLNGIQLEDKGFQVEPTGVEEKNEECLHSSSEGQSIIAQLIQEVQELKAFRTEQIQKTSILEQKLMEAEREIQRLKDCCVMMLEPVSNPSVALVNETVSGVIDELHLDHNESASEEIDELHLDQNESVNEVIDELHLDHNESVSEVIDELHLDHNESVFLAGGYDGKSWLSSLDSYYPSHDVIKSLKPMNCARSYFSAAQLNNDLYVFGGGSGQDSSKWYDTVESYSLANDQWTSRPSLNQKKGSLAAATIDNKIFAIGGGNNVECFSNVEMLDLDIGRWIATRSMLQKRFAVAAVELNGALYASGGYDGKDYLMSAERFDPREHSWTKIASMNTKRGSHSLVVLNEKLYALGGFDGSRMVSSVEIFDPRLGSWMSGESMKNPRGYFAAGVINESIFVMGGIKVGQNILETVETYKDGQGWQETQTMTIGKRCFLSAIVMKGIKIPCNT